MSTLVLLGAAPLVLLTASACYTDKINKAPIARITVDGATQALTIMGPKPTLSARLSSDADHDVLTYSWELHCLDEADCPIKTAATRDVTFAFADKPRAHQPVVATLRVTDPRGATSVTSQTFQAVDQPPMITIAESADNQKNRQGHYTVGRELTLLVTSKSDPDDDDVPPPTWSISKSPAGAQPDTRGGDNDSFVIRPDKPSDDQWTVRATVDDGFGGTQWAEINLQVQDDLPPCLEGVDPELPDGFAVVVHRAGGPRRFTVGTVSDDLDSFPLAASPDDRSGVAAFRWSLVLPGPAPVPPDPQVPQVVGGQVTNVFSFDPATYAPGDHVAVRVDVLDRVQRSCPVEQPSCAAEPGCRSRYTWNVEVR